MAAREPYLSLLRLEIGDCLLVEPEEGETVEEALKRLKKRFSTWRKTKEQSYVAEVVDGKIRVTRTELGANKKLWRWEAMKAGEIIVLKLDPTAKDLRSAKNTAQYLMSTKGAGAVWDVGIVQSKLIARCLVDKEGGSVERKKARKETPEERRARAAWLARYIADRFRSNAPQFSKALREEMLGKAAYLLDEAEALEAGFDGISRNELDGGGK